MAADAISHRPSGPKEAVRGLSEAAWRADIRCAAVISCGIGNVLGLFGRNGVAADRRDLAFWFDCFGRESVARFFGDGCGFYGAVGDGVAPGQGHRRNCGAKQRNRMKLTAGPGEASLRNESHVISSLVGHARMQPRDTPSRLRRRGRNRENAQLSRDAFLTAYVKFPDRHRRFAL